VQRKGKREKIVSFRKEVERSIFQKGGMSEQKAAWRKSAVISLFISLHVPAARRALGFFFFFFFFFFAVFDA